MLEKKEFINLKSWGTLTALISAYTTLIALLYQYGFWLHFGINPLAYSSISDTASSVLLIAIPIAIIVFISGLPLYFLFYKERTKAYILYKFFGFAFVLSLMLAFYFFYQISSQKGLDIKSYVLFMMPALVIMLASTRSPIIKAAIPERSFRIFIIGFIVILPFVGFNIGWQFSNIILENDRYSFIPMEYIPESIKKLSDDKGIKYIGKIGEHIFLSSFDNEALIIMLDRELSPLVLKEYRK